MITPVEQIERLLSSEYGEQEWPKELTLRMIHCAMDPFRNYEGYQAPEQFPMLKDIAASKFIYQSPPDLLYWCQDYLKKHGAFPPEIPALPKNIDIILGSGVGHRSEESFCNLRDHFFLILERENLHKVGDLSKHQWVFVSKHCEAIRVPLEYWA